MKKFNKYETVLLLETSLKILDNKKSRSVEIEKLSQNLRKLAKNQGAELSNDFRSNTGLRYQCKIMICTLNGETLEEKRKQPLFKEIVEMYRNHRNEYEELLKEAHSLISPSNNKTIQKKKETSDRNICPSKYVYHRNFHYGVIKNEDNDFYKIVFDEEPNKLKSILKSFAGLRFITEEEYLRNKIPTHEDFPQTDIMLDLKQESLTEFTEWLTNEVGLAERTGTGYTSNVKTASKLCMEYEYSDEELYNLSDDRLKQTIEDLYNDPNFREYNDIQHNRFTAALNKYLDFRLGTNNSKFDRRKSDDKKNLDEPIDSADYEAIINENFEDGFSYNNPLQKRKFVRLYTEKFDCEFIDDDRTYMKKIANSGFVWDEKVYPIKMIAEDLKLKLEDYILTNITGDISILFYKNIYENFSDDLPPIFDDNLLKQYLKKMFKDEFAFEEDYITIKGMNVDVKQQVINLFMNQYKPLDKEEIYRELPIIPKDEIDFILSDRDFVLNFRGKSYFYREIFVIKEDELQKIKEFLDQKIYSNGFATGTEMCLYIHSNIPNLVETNPEITDLGIRNVLKLYLEDMFGFKGDIISKKSDNLDIKTLFDDFCKHREEFTLEDLELFRDEINANYIDFDAVFQNSVRIREEKYVRKNLISFEVEKIDKAIKNYCLKDYISFEEIINFAEFPTISYPWNNYVLESYLYSSSEDFKLVHGSFNQDYPVGGIVKKNSTIQTFDDLLVKVIKDNRLYERERALDYLLENKFIRRRKIKNIDFLIEKAEQEV